jgi:AcrR family transcriptional regulator
MAQQPRSAQQHRGPSSDRLFDAAMALAAARPWHRVSLADIAAEAKVGLDELYGVYPGKGAILAALAQRTDRAMLAVKDKEAADAPVRERLLDVLMRRFDALGKHKDAVASIVRSGGGEPVAALCAGARLLRSMAWTLEAAGIGSNGVLGMVRTRALAAIYVSAVLVWLRDDSPDLGRTLAHLDRSLRRAERLVQACPEAAPPRRRRASV